MENNKINWKKKLSEKISELSEDITCNTKVSEPKNIAVIEDKRLTLKQSTDILKEILAIADDIEDGEEVDTIRMMDIIRKMVIVLYDTVEDSKWLLNTK